MSDKKPLDMLVACTEKLDRIRNEMLRYSGDFLVEQLSQDGWPYLNMVASSSRGVARLRVSITPHPVILADFLEAKKGTECRVEITWSPDSECWKMKRLNCPPEIGIIPEQAFHLQDGQPSEDLRTLLDMIWRVVQMADQSAP